MIIFLFLQDGCKYSFVVPSKLRDMHVILQGTNSHLL